jgi:hypothetical protein
VIDRVFRELIDVILVASSTRLRFSCIYQVWKYRRCQCLSIIGRIDVLEMNRLIDDDDASQDFAQGRLTQLSMGLDYQQHVSMAITSDTTSRKNLEPEMLLAHSVKIPATWSHHTKTAEQREKQVAPIERATSRLKRTESLFSTSGTMNR